MKKENKDKIVNSKEVVKTDKRTELSAITAQKKYDLAQIRLKLSKDKKDKIEIMDNSNKLGNQFNKSGQNNINVKEVFEDLFSN